MLSKVVKLLKELTEESNSTIVVVTNNRSGESCEAKGKDRIDAILKATDELLSRGWKSDDCSCVDKY